MSSESIFFITTYLAQAVEAMVIALVIMRLAELYKKDYLKQWTRSWISLCIYCLFGGLSLSLAARGIHSDHILRIITTVLSLVAGYCQLAWLTFGVYEIIYEKTLARRQTRRILVLSAFMGIISSLLFVGDPDLATWRFCTRVGLRCLISGVVFISAGYLIWSVKQRRHILGYRILSTAFFIYGIGQLQYSFLTVFQLFNISVISYSRYLGFVDYLMHLIMGLAMVLWFLDEERSRVKRATDMLEHLAYHDALTRLPNRSLFLDRLNLAIDQAARSKRILAVALMNLDRFKVINDTYGHALGDELLRLVADRLIQVIRKGDTLAKFGGDEFGIIISEIQDSKEAEDTLKQILVSFQNAFLLQNREVFLTTSIGASFYPDHGDQAEDLLRKSHTATYTAKSAGGARYEYYRPEMITTGPGVLSLENDLRKAFSRGEFLLHYQPIINPATEKIEGVEALIRWNHPQKGILMPSDFLTHAESLGMSDKLNLWALKEACGQGRLWHANGFDEITISINLLARLFQHPSLISEINGILTETGINPSWVQFEVTETLAMQNADMTLRALRDLKNLGVRIAIDDFGTGYSSLSYLKNFPIDMIKMDQSFIQDVSSDGVNLAIVEAIIHLAHSLNLRVVAEGVEKAEQYDLLVSRKCDLIQGFLLSNPLAARDMESQLLDTLTGLNESLERRQ